MGRVDCLRFVIGLLGAFRRFHVEHALSARSSTPGGALAPHSGPRIPLEKHIVRIRVNYITLSLRTGERVL